MRRFLNAAVVSAVISSILGLLGFAFAQTGAGTPITNTATATYTNAANQSLTAQSNTVTTTVQPVYRFAITPNGTDTKGGAGQNQTGAAGGTAVFTYQLENQGNTGNPDNTDYPNGNTINLSALDSATDTFDFGTKTVYRDNPDGGTGNVGVLDAGDFVVGTGSGSVTVPYGQVITLFVEAAIPGTATDNQVGRLNLEGRSATGGETDLDNWAELTAFTNAALTLNKTATSNVTPGGTISYDVSGTNTLGTNPYVVTAVANLTNAPAGPRNGILVSDVIPAGLIYVPGSLKVTSNTTNTFATLYSVNGGTSYSTTQPARGVNAVALLIVGTPGQRIGTNGSAPFTYSLTFDAQVPIGAVAGANQYPNTGTIRYDSDGDSDGADAGEVVTSNETTTTVDPSGAFAVGPYTFPNGDANGSSYTVPNEGYTVTRSGDTQTVASVPNEREVSFRQSLQNATNFDDSYTPSSASPAGFSGSVNFYAVNPDGSRGAAISTLAVAAGNTAEFYTVVALPADYTATTPLSVAVTATSANGAANGTNTTDTTTNTIGAVTEAQAVNIGNYAGNAAPNDASVNFPAQPNSTVNIPLIVRNNGADPDTFDLTTAIAPAFPAGYVLTIYWDENCDNIVDGADTVVTDTTELQPATFECYIVQITVPAGATPETYGVTVTAISQNDPDVSDSVTNTLTVELLQDFTFTPTPQSQATSATVPVVYTHTLTNNSNDAAAVDLTFDGGTTGWNYEYSLTGAEGSYTAALPQAIPVGANGGSQAVYVRVTPDPDALEGDADTFTLTATPTYGDVIGAAASVTDTTTIDQEFFGELELTKTVSVNGGPAGTDTQAEPGDTLTYTVTTTNLGSGTLTNVKVQDAVPINTTFVSAIANASGGLAGNTVLYSTTGTNWSQTPPATLATGASIFVGVSTNGNNDVTEADMFPDDGVLTLTLTVTVN